MTFQISKILAVIDPTTDKQLALIRALNIAQRADATVHAYLCCYSTVESNHFRALKRTEIVRHEAWLKTVIASENLDGVDVTTQVEWNEDWRQALADTAAEVDCDLIVKATRNHTATLRNLLRTSDWAVLRHAQCPVLLVKRDSIAPVRRILIAVNPKVEDAPHQQLNADIIAIGKQITEDRDDFELHAVCAYSDSETFTHPSDLAKLVGIDETRAHCAGGIPDDVIVEWAKTLDSELVVVGTVSRSGLTSLMKGNTAEHVLDRLETDVLVATAHNGINSVASAA